MVENRKKNTKFLYVYMKNLDNKIIISCILNPNHNENKKNINHETIDQSIRKLKFLFEQINKFKEIQYNFDCF